MSETIKHCGEITQDQLIEYEKNGVSIRFDNGCFLTFEEDQFGKHCAGDNPYGGEALFLDDIYLERVIAWIKYWNEDRDERGNICHTHTIH